MITGNEIVKQISEGRIVIDPFKDDHVGPNSYDLTLSDEIGYYKHKTLDALIENEVHIRSFEKYLLQPGKLYLMSTVERTHSDYFIPLIEGKSSIGRLGIDIHKTAGVGDIGFNGRWTLEVTVVHPVWVYAGMKIAQVMFYQPVGEVGKLYTGRYQHAVGVEASKYYYQ